jgi:hypothetical protein
VRKRRSIDLSFIYAVNPDLGPERHGELPPEIVRRKARGIGGTKDKHMTATRAIPNNTQKIDLPGIVTMLCLYNGGTTHRS